MSPARFLHHCTPFISSMYRCMLSKLLTLKRERALGNDWNFYHYPWSPLHLKKWSLCKWLCVRESCRMEKGSRPWGVSDKSFHCLRPYLQPWKMNRLPQCVTGVGVTISSPGNHTGSGPHGPQVALLRFSLTSAGSPGRTSLLICALVSPSVK